MPIPERMQAWRIHATGPMDQVRAPLTLDEIAVPQPAAGEVLLRVTACGICHTELDEIEGRTPPPQLPVTPGHQVVGVVAATGPGVSEDLLGQRAGVAWIYSTCGSCRYCRAGLENLCAEFAACGRDADGGYAQFMVAPEAFVVRLPDALDDHAAAPLLCAGSVGLRAIRLCQLDQPLDHGMPVGLTGFGASGHLVLQMLRHRFPDSPVYVFARNRAEREFARSLGAAWAGDTADAPPRALAAIIDTTPAWKPILSALAALQPGGRLVINAISKEANDVGEWLDIDYGSQLWREKILRSVTNVTRQDVQECLALAEEIALRPAVEMVEWTEANEALRALKAGGNRGAKVLRVDDAPSPAPA